MLMAIGLYFTPSVLIWIRIFGATMVYFGLMWFWGELDSFKKTGYEEKSRNKLVS
tara:strand:- start:655 stop:819 length:165 start_codon:yes stop_codon:yes gene_type:complete